MNMRFVRAALAACLLGSAAIVAVTAPLSPAFAKSSGPTVSPAVGKLLQPAQKAMQANDYKTAMDLIKQAQALPDQTPFDTYTINNFLANTAIGLKDYATADTAYEAMADSSALPDEDKATTFHNATLLAAQAKHYDKAIKYGQTYLGLSGITPDPQIMGTMAQAYYLQNDFANAETMAKKALDATPAGQAPNRAALEIMLSSQVKANHQDQAVATLEQIVTYYDDPDDWGQLIGVSLGVKGIKDYEALDISRLRLPTHATTSAEDYAIWGALALSLSFPVEADAIFQTGLSSGKLTSSGKVGQQIATARSGAATDRKTISSFDATARKSANGELDAKLADTYFGYGRYDDAVEAARRAMQKGGKVDHNQMNMVIAMSLAMKGDAAGANAAFGAIKSPSAGMARAQHVWQLYINRKTSTAAAAPGH
jgi:tetratricopeptide (TPR) repeat protein